MKKSDVIPPEVADFLQLKKTVHITIPHTTLNTVKELLEEEGGVTSGLSLQSVFAEVAARLALGDQYLLDLIHHLRQNHTEKNFSIAKTDLNDLFDVLEQESPLKR